MITSNQINYVAGILEGEDYFKFSNTFSIVLNMTDEDVVCKIRDIMDKNREVRRYKHANNININHKTNYNLAIHGNIAVQWMMTLYSLMGVRRKEKIKEILYEWKTTNRKTNGTDEMCNAGHPLLIINRDYKFKDSGHKICLHCRRKAQRHGVRSKCL